MSDLKIEKILDSFLLVTLFGFLFYALYEAGNKRTFDTSCANACAPKSAITPVIDFQNQCLCDEGHGKWRYQDVKRAD